MRPAMFFQPLAQALTRLSRVFARPAGHKSGVRIGKRIRVAMKFFRTGFFLAFMSVSASVQAQEAKQTAIDVVQAELSICVVYYSFVRGCAIEKSDINTATVANTNADKLRKYAFQAGQSIRMDNESMIKRQKIAIEQQQKLLEGNCENIGKLEEAYGNRCKQLSDDPKAILDQYLKK